MRQTWAIVLDGYRELNAKKLFWLALAISALVVLAFSAVALTPTGIKVLAWEFPFDLNLSLISNATFYKLMFQSLGISFWLTWAASILGLVATCAMIPDFTAGGAVELALSKPISRARLFLTKYFTGLLFMFLQVSVFSLAAFLLIGIRGREWVPSLLLAVPIVTLTYSYLFSVCALVGLITRSTIFSLVATLIVWLLIFAVHTLETGVMLQLRVAAEMNVQRTQQWLDGDSGEGGPATKPATGFLGSVVNAIKPGPKPPNREDMESRLERHKEEVERWTAWHQGFYVLKTVLPKTSETTGLLQRAIFAKGELDMFMDSQVEHAERMQENQKKALGRKDPLERALVLGDPRVSREAEKRVNQRSVWWVLGTSVGFEAILLTIACWLFARRDF